MHNLPDCKVTDYLKELSWALRQAQDVHERQPRLLGEELGLSYYHTHILPVVKMVPLPARPAAALHDVAEDGKERTADEWFEFLRVSNHYSEDTLTAVILLTRGAESYADYIKNLTLEVPHSHVDFLGRMIACQVKLADIIHNLGHLPVEDSLRTRYIPALALVAAAVSYYEKAYKQHFNSLKSRP